MIEELRVLMIAALSDDLQRIEQLLVEARETGRLPALQVKFESEPDAVSAAGVLAHGAVDAVFLMLTAPEDLHTLADLHHAYPDLTTVVGVSVLEESLALLAMTRGAADYWLKDACAARDIAAIFRQVLVSKQLKSSQQRLRWLEEGISEVVWRAQPDLRWVETTASIQRLAGYSVQEALGMSLPDFLAPASREALLSGLQKTPLYPSEGATLQDLTLELEHLHKNGKNFWAEFLLHLETDGHGQVVGVQGLTRDVTGYHAIQEKIDYISLHDPLTGLFNRIYFEEEINRLEFSRYYPITILKADFEGLRAINDDHGRPAGDEMLKRVANILRAAFRSEDMISRMSGNDFVVIMPRANARAAGRALQRVLNLVDGYNQGDPELPLNIKMEVVTAETGESLLETFKSVLTQKSNKKVPS